MARTPSNSSNLSAFEYVSEGKILVVDFKSGRTYRYHKVPLDLFTKLILSESQGKFFKAEIQGKFEQEEVLP